MRAPLLGNPTGRVLGARSGWRVGTSSSVVSVTSTTWTLNPCAAMIEPAAMLYQGAYPWVTDAAITGSVTAADATNPRIDILYIQINDSSAGDGSGSLSAPVGYLAGVAAATPVAPTLPPRSFLVATINVPKSGGGSPTAVFNAQYFVASGAVLPVMSQAERDGLTPYDGFRVMRMDTPARYIQTWNGTAWDGPGTITPAALTIKSGWSNRGAGFATPGAYRSAGRVYLCGAVTNTSATTSLTALIPYVPVQLPAGFAPTKASRFPIQFQPTQQSGSSTNGYVQVDNSGNLTIALSSTVSGMASGDATIDFGNISWLDA
jgi:hypothetical protein